MSLAGIEEVDAIPTLPPRPADSHKGTFGTALIIAGSRGMAGAAGLAGAAALRSGAGLVRIACPKEVTPIVAGWEPCYMAWPLAQTSSGVLDFSHARADLERLASDANAIAAGPGLGRSPSTRELGCWLTQTPGPPLVLDADVLNELAEFEAWETRLGRTVIVTPHPGEMARLLGTSVATVQADRRASAIELARRSPERRLIVVLKGDGSVVTDGRRVFTNSTGNPGMATGGSGDVLTGVIVALLAQRLDPFEAAVLGVHVHGTAGDLACDEEGEVSMTAADIVDELAEAFSHLDS
jgi:NAD(P)H-hydrate epimerase